MVPAQRLLQYPGATNRGDRCTKGSIRPRDWPCRHRRFGDAAHCRREPGRRRKPRNCRAATGTSGRRQVCCCSRRTNSSGHHSSGCDQSRRNARHTRRRDKSGTGDCCARHCGAGNRYRRSGNCCRRTRACDRPGNRCRPGDDATASRYRRRCATTGSRSGPGTRRRTSGARRA